MPMKAELQKFHHSTSNTVISASYATF